MRSNRKIWARGLALGAVVSLAAGVLAGCGSAKGGEDEALGKNDTLTITTFGDFGYSDSIKKWNADPKSPFKVKETKIAQWDTWKQTLTTELQSGSGLTDIVGIEGDAMPAFLADGASDQFVDLTDKSLDGRWVDYKYKAGQTADGKQIGYPTDAGPEAICYRADLFKQAGLPSDRDSVAKLFPTWDDYFKVGQLFEKKLPKTKWYDSSGSIAQAMLNQTQFPFQTKDQKVDVDNAELKGVYDTVSKYAPTLSTKVVQWSDDWTANFKNNGFATMPCPGWMFANIKGSAKDVKGWDIADTFPGGGGNWGGSFLAVPTQSKHAKEAKKFANWLTDTDQQVAAFNAAGAYPSNAAAEKELSTKGSPDAYFNNADTAKILANRAAAVKPDAPFKGDKYSDILGLFQTAIQRVDEGKKPADSWATFVQAVNGLN